MGYLGINGAFFRAGGGAVGRFGRGYPDSLGRVRDMLQKVLAGGLSFWMISGALALGLIGAPTASADCDVNLGECDDGQCTVNTGQCTGSCEINAGDKCGGTCIINGPRPGVIGFSVCSGDCEVNFDYCGGECDNTVNTAQCPAGSCIVSPAVPTLATCLEGECEVNLGFCSGGDCMVNLLDCREGKCDVSLGTCSGGDCTVSIECETGKQCTVYEGVETDTCVSVD